MVFALISDVHANLEALTAVLKDIRKNTQARKIVFLGDAVGYGADPNEVLTILDSECEIKLMGNHDYSVLGLQSTDDFNPLAQQAVAYATSILSEPSRKILSAFQLTGETEQMLLVHATPEAPSEWNYCLSLREADRQFKYFDKPLCCLGHSHKPTVYRLDRKNEISNFDADRVQFDPKSRYIVNTGSVGQPRDGDPRSCYALFDTELNTLSYRRVAYDVATAQAKMSAARLPDYLIERLSVGK